MNVTDKLLPELDLDNIVKKTANENNWSIEQAQEAEMQYRAFLKANQMEMGQDFAPNFTIDEVWHNHILDTKKYQDDCAMLFDGGVLHHVPTYGDNPEENNLLQRIANKTKQYFKENFGLSLNYTPDGQPSNDFANNAIATCQGKCHVIHNSVTCGGQTRCRTSTTKGLAFGS